MLEFSIKDVPFFHLSDELPFFNGTIPSFALAFNGDYVKLMLLVFLLLYAVGYSIISGIIFYHWNTYGMKTKTIVLAKTVFTVMSLGIYVLLFSITLSL